VGQSARAAQSPAEICANSPRRSGAIPSGWRAVSSQPQREFLYVRRHLPPAEAQAGDRPGIPGVHLQREYRRFYPAGEVSRSRARLHQHRRPSGRKGSNSPTTTGWRGENGEKRVRRDRLGNAIEDVESIRPAAAGPRPAPEHRPADPVPRLPRAQARRAARTARSPARWWCSTCAPARCWRWSTSRPQPERPRQLEATRYRNRATNDIFEPGSSIKPLVVAAALSSGRFNAESVVDTGPGWFTVGAKTIEDKNNLGRIDLSTLLVRSSNVGASKVALALEPDQLWSELRRFGLGEVSATGFPGESAGVLMEPDLWRPIGQATLAYGYGLSVTPLQLAHAYAILGAHGRALPVSLLAVDQPPQARQAIDASAAATVLAMMEPVASREGTAPQAAITGYRVAGKTGTARKFTAGGYHADRYLSVFAGVAPASEPRLAAVIMIDEPSAGVFYGGEVAGPVFSRVVGDALRILGIPPDDGADARSVGTLVQAMGRP
jgi:cell division protein FtsI (penicillin-binding protein 3)